MSELDSGNVAQESRDELAQLTMDMAGGEATAEPQSEAKPDEAVGGGKTELQETSGSSNYDTEVLEELAPGPTETTEEAETDAPRRRGSGASEHRASSFRDEMASVNQRTQQLIDIIQSQQQAQQLAQQPARSAPKADPKVAARQDAQRHLARMSKDNDVGGFFEALDAYHAPERAESAAALQAAHERVEALERMQRSPGEDKLFADFPFLSEGKYADMADGYVKIIAAREGRDMDNPKQRLQTHRDAAAMVRKEEKIGGSKDNPNRVNGMRRLGGSTMRETALDSFPENNMSEGQKKLAAAWKPGMDPTAAARKWWKEIGSKIR